MSRRGFVSGVSDTTEGRDDATMRGKGLFKNCKSKSNQKAIDLQASAELRRQTRRLAARQIHQFSWSRVSANKRSAKTTNSILPLGLAVARLGRFPMGRDHPQGADTELQTPTK